MSNINDVRVKEIPIILGGKERHLKFTLNSFADLEDKFGNVDTAMEALNKGSIKAVRALLWVGMRHGDDRNITEEEVGDMIGLGELAELSKTLTEAITAALPAQPTPDPNASTQK